MAKLTRAAFAKVAGVSAPAVTQAVRSVKLVVQDGLLDTDHPINAAYLARSGHQRAKGRDEKRRRALAQAASSLEPPKGKQVEIDFGPVGAKERAEIRRINAQAGAAEAKLAREVGRVIERDKVRAALGRFGAAMQDRLLTLGTRLAPKLEAVFDTGGRSAQIRAVIDDEMADAIKALKAAAASEGLA